MQALQDEPITIFGNGQQTRVFCDVDELIEAFIRLTRSIPKDLPRRALFSSPDLFPVNHERSLITRTTNTVNNTAALNRGASGL